MKRIMLFLCCIGTLFALSQPAAAQSHCRAPTLYTNCMDDAARAMNIGHGRCETQYQNCWNQRCDPNKGKSADCSVCAVLREDCDEAVSDAYWADVATCNRNFCEPLN